MKYIFSLLTTLFGITNSLYLNETFSKFLDFTYRYNKVYDDNEIVLRYNIFEQNLNTINNHNSQNHTWTMAINQFADMTPEEFKSYTLCYNSPKLDNVPRISFDNVFKPSLIDTPDQIDWTSKGAVTGVKDQGSCGSCWSFSTTGGVEGSYFLSTGDLKSFSEQQLVDCSTSYGNQGCQGGLMTDAFKYIQDNGICLESDYTYSAMDGKCKKCTVVTKIDSFIEIPTNNEDALKQAVSMQPVSVAIEADQGSFQFYSKGVMTSSCGTNLDHGVLAVGYGTLNGVDYWKVKNSWGENWGDSGYILLQRNTKDSAGQCGITLMASYPVITNSLFE